MGLNVQYTNKKQTKLNFNFENSNTQYVNTWTRKHYPRKHG